MDGETEARMLGDLLKACLAPKLLLLIYPELSHCGIRGKVLGVTFKYTLLSLYTQLRDTHLWYRYIEKAVFKGTYGPFIQQMCPATFLEPPGH